MVSTVGPPYAIKAQLIMKRTRKLLNKEIAKLNDNGHSLFCDHSIAGYMFYTNGESKRLSNYLTLREAWTWLDAYRYGHETARIFPKPGYYKVSRFLPGVGLHWTKAERGTQSTNGQGPMTAMEAEVFQDMIKRGLWTTLSAESLYRIVAPWD